MNEEKLEKIIEKRIEEKKEDIREEVKKDLLKQNNQNKEEKVDRRSFLKKAGAGTIGLGAMFLSPAASKLTITNNGIEGNTGLNFFDSGSRYFQINTGGPVEVKNADLQLNSNRITGLADPSSAQDAATRSWVNSNLFSGSHNDLANVSSNDHHSKTSSASELSDVSPDSNASAHHSRYSDSEARTAVDGSNVSVSHDNLTGVSASDHHSKTSSASELSDVSPDSNASAHHSRYSDSEARTAVNGANVDIAGDADTVDGQHASEIGKSLVPTEVEAKRNHDNTSYASDEEFNMAFIVFAKIQNDWPDEIATDPRMRIEYSDGSVTEFVQSNQGNRSWDWDWWQNDGQGKTIDRIFCEVKVGTADDDFTTSYARVRGYKYV